MTAKMPMSGSPEKRRDCIAQLPLRPTSAAPSWHRNRSAEEIQLENAHCLFIDIIGSSERFSALSLRFFCLPGTLSQDLMYRAHLRSPEMTERSSRKS